MKKNIFLVAIFAVLGLALAMMPELAIAQDAGESALDDLLAGMTGSIGTFVGLLIALFGLYVWLVQQNTWGIMIIIAGVAVTAFPGIFDGMRDGLNAALSNTGASTSSTQGDLNR